MSKFKVGDKVRFVPRSPGWKAQKGATAIVTGLPNDFSRWLGVEWVRDELSGTQRDGGYYIEDFEVFVEEKKLKTIVVNVVFENGEEVDHSFDTDIEPKTYFDAITYAMAYNDVVRISDTMVVRSKMVRAIYEID